MHPLLILILKGLDHAGNTLSVWFQFICSYLVFCNKFAKDAVSKTPKSWKNAKANADPAMIPSFSWRKFVTNA